VRYLGKTLHKEFTDLALVIGPNARWVEDDYEDLQRDQPEVLLGYRVRLYTAFDIERGQHRGTRPEKVVLLDAPFRDDSQWERVHQEVQACLASGYFPKAEVWHVHRREGIWRIT
jgi:hypothetical protein